VKLLNELMARVDYLYLPPLVLDVERPMVRRRTGPATCMRPLIAHCHLGLGKLHRRTGQREQAREHLATATAMYRDMDMTYWLKKAVVVVDGS
jgi:hypothetical protein